MLNKIFALLSEAGAKPEAGAFAAKDTAIAALLLEAASADGEADQSEISKVTSVIESRLGLPRGRAEALVAAGHARQLQAVQLFAFTDAIKKSCSEDERAAIIEMLWEVVYADGVLDPFEDRLVRNAAGLLHVSDRARAEARQRALARKGRNGGDTTGDQTP